MKRSALIWREQTKSFNKELSVKYFNLERVESVHLDVNINNQILICYCVLCYAQSCILLC
jgi:hypothetical protein